jgi:BirA family biotin operon repressor/biotin-[acetyl-CoA-carboxylase] ligase
MNGPSTTAASLNIPLLNRLRAAAGDYVPLDELACELAAAAETGSDGASRSLDRARVVVELDALAAFGFAIERHPDRDARYTGPAERLCPDQIEHELGTSRIGRRIAVWSRAASTNDLAAQAAGSESNDGLVVLAEEQTAGRGRLGRSWTAPPRSSILMSVLIFPPRPLDPAGPGAGPSWLTALGAVAAADAVSAWIGRDAAIKWPNDVRVDGRKIAGILVERPSTDAGAAVIGIGLNVNIDREDFPPELRAAATSLRIECSGRPLDRSEVARSLIRRLDHWYVAARSLGGAALSAPWRDRNERLGQFVRVSTTAGPHSGRLVDLDLRLGVTLEVEPAPSDAAEGPSGRRDGVPSVRIRLPLADVLAIEPVPLTGRSPA